MSRNLETRPENLTGYIPPGRFENTFRGITQLPGRILAEGLIRNTELVFEAETEHDIAMGIHEGYMPIIVGNHASHADGLTISKLTNYLTERYHNLYPFFMDFKGFSMPLAQSLLTGNQGWSLRVMYQYAEEPMARNHLLALPIIREKDRDKYGIPLDDRRYIRSLKRRVDDGYKGIVLYPEGTTEGGKTENGALKGMQEFEESSIPGHMRLLAKFSGQKVMLIPVGVTGGSEIIDSNIKGVPLRSIKRLVDLRMVKIRVGNPTREDDPEFRALQTLDEVNNFVGRRIAALLPPEMRGVYALSAQ